ncbi:MAG: hypothetical protein A2X34_01190 [Elusimicrobia bacterium GWC2_51_8]|nr:MAG: hypothetical protein A2X33_09800 [Elusimicrobia bacterium GWA2_51_34]OGR60097.1 MAG: hypothetical protein A2X34_01190 [Elusimicrobia bacterium GWC2_51_8]OGR85616.1 MAG: hypothetical protein A2021_07695 [Elusimicrobia bacterium GWF2_52_66]HAF95880.1 hypothetical protein [Elusimicrobiota bacterium]HCE97991.1 hypothetical protein [Elusimicrobiota bacterium]
MPNFKIFLITANETLAANASKAFASAGFNFVLQCSCADFFAQGWRDAGIVFLDLACVGQDKPAELKKFLGKMREVSVIAMCETPKTSNREMIEILASGVDDAISTSIEMSLLMAKTRAYIRRVEVRRMIKTEQAAKKWCQDGGN